MSFAIVKTQHLELNRLFEEHYDDFASIGTAVKDELHRLVDEKQLDDDTLAWALQSLDLSEHTLTEALEQTGP